jgi:hypothetical protein
MKILPDATVAEIITIGAVCIKSWEVLGIRIMYNEREYVYSIAFLFQIEICEKEFR